MHIAMAKALNQLVVRLHRLGVVNLVVLRGPDQTYLKGYASLSQTLVIAPQCSSLLVIARAPRIARNNFLHWVKAARVPSACPAQLARAGTSGHERAASMCPDQGEG